MRPFVRDDYGIGIPPWIDHLHRPSGLLTLCASLAREVLAPLNTNIGSDANMMDGFAVVQKRGDSMTTIGWIQILLYAVVIFALTKPLGIYMFRVLEGDRQPLPRFFAPIERLIYRLSGIDARAQQTWKEYSAGLLAFSLFGVLVLYGLQRLQHLLPLNPQGLGSVSPDLSFSTATSFTTNTNWQAYAGETTLSYLTQMAGLTWQNFVSAAAGIGVMLAIARGLTCRLKPNAPKTLGNFWVDVIRSTVYLLLPLSIILTLVLVWQGVLQNLSAYVELTTIEGGKQTLAMGPAASRSSPVAGVL